MTTGSRAIVDVGAVLDTARFRGLPLLVMACAAAIMVLDGFDIQIIGFAAPALTAEFGIDRSALAPALAASLIGMAIGGFALGPWGDRHGRRPAVLLSVTIFGLGTLLTAMASSVELLTALRLVTGIGLGGALPNATALMAEFSPPRVRGQAIAAAIVGVPIGGMVGAALAAEIIPAFGWRALFVVGGVAPLIAVFVLYLVLPESPRFLTWRKGRERELSAILNRIAGAGSFTEDSNFVLSSQAAVRDAVVVDGVFSRNRLRDTIALWLIFITNLFAVYCFYNWAPVVLTSLGMELATAVRGSLVFNSAGVVGSIMVSWLIARSGSRVPQTVLGIVGALALFYVGHLVGDSAAVAGGSPTRPPVTLIMIGLAVAGFCILAVQVTMYAVAAHVYPTSCRATGVGWAQGVGRLGGVLSAFLGAVIMARAGAAGFFVTITLVLMVTVIGVLLLRRHIPAGVADSTPSEPVRAPLL